MQSPSIKCKSVATGAARAAQESRVVYSTGSPGAFFLYIIKADVSRVLMGQVPR